MDALGTSSYLTNPPLTTRERKLVKALKVACECVAYCRRAHRDIQSESGGGAPVEYFWRELIDECEGKSR